MNQWIKVPRRVTSLAAIAGLAVIVMVGLSFFAFAQESRPNIILILCDDAGIGEYQPYSDRLGVPKNAALRTPHTEQLAKQGMSFMRAHSTGSVCQPSRFSIVGRSHYRPRPVDDDDDE